MLLALSFIIIFLLIIINKALGSKSKLLEFELNISIKCFKLSFKTNENSTPRLSAISRKLIFLNSIALKLKTF